MFLKKLNPVKVMLIQDAIFMVALSRRDFLQARKNLFENELDAVSIICKETSCSRSVARLLLDQAVTLEELYLNQVKVVRNGKAIIIFEGDN